MLSEQCSGCSFQLFCSVALLTTNIWLTWITSLLIQALTASLSSANVHGIPPVQEPQQSKRLGSKTFTVLRSAMILLPLTLQDANEHSFKFANPK